MPREDLAVTYSAHVLTEDEDPDGSRRDQQLRAIVALLRRANEAERAQARARRPGEQRA